MPLYLSDTPPTAAVEVAYEYYRIERFRALQGDVTFWVPIGQTQLETLKLLLESYEKATEHIRMVI